MSEPAVGKNSGQSPADVVPVAEAARAVADRHTAIFDALPAHLALLDNSGVILVVNESWRRFAAENGLLSPGFGVGANYLEVCDGAAGECAEGAGAAACGLRQVLAGDVPEFSLEYPCHSPTERRWFRLIVTPVSADRRIGAVVLHLDITERKLAEEALRGSEREQRQLAEQLEAERARLVAAQAVAKVGSWETDLTTLVVRWSEETHRIFERSPDPLRPLTHEEFLGYLHPEDRAAVDAAFLRSFSQPGIHAIEHRLLLPGGRVKFVEERWQAFTGEDGRPARAIGTCQDITTRKEAAASVERGRTLMRMAARLGRIGAWSVELPDIRLTWSAEVCALHEVPPGHQPSLEEALAFYPPQHREVISGAFGDCARGGTTFDLELQVVTARGRLLWVRVIGEAQRDESGAIRRVQGASQDITDRREAAEATARLAEQLSATLESITDAFYTLDRDWRFTYVNPEAERLLLRSRHELLGRNMWEEFPDTQGTVFEREIRRALADRQTVAFEDFYPPLGAWFAGRVYPSEQGLAVYFRDVTATRAAREAVRVSEERFRLLAKATNDAIWDWDFASRALWWNEGFETLFGFRRDEVEPTIDSRNNRIHPDDKPAILAGVQRAIDSRAESWSGEYRFLRKDGGYAYVLDRGHIIRDGDGKPMRMIGGMTDLTERKRIEEEVRWHAEQLRVSEEQYRLLFADNPQPMWVFDWESLRFVAVNPAAVRHYGYAEAEFLEMTIGDIRSPEDADELRRALRMRPKEGKWHERSQHFRKDGTRLDVEITSSNILFDGRPSRLVVVNDVTERLQAEREAARANRALRVLSDCNEALIRANSEGELLHNICRIAVEVGGIRMAWVGYAEETAGKPIVPQAYAGAEEDYLAVIRLSWSEDDATGHGPAAQAIRTGQPVVACDLTDGNSGFQTVGEALRRGYRGVICLPLMNRTRAFGVVALYLAEVRDVPAEELAVFKEMADDLAFGIVNQRAHLERRRTHDAVLAMARGISASLGEEFFQKLTLSMVEALGAHSGFVSQLILPGRDRAQTISAVVEGQLVPNFAYDLAGTPCGQLDRGEVCVIEREARQRFPQAPVLAEMAVEAYVGMRLLDATGRPSGLMFVQFQHPLTQPEFIVSTLKIFAARAAAELERQESDRTLREQAALIDQARDAICVRDIAHRVTFWSKGAERLYGWTAAEAVGRRLHELLSVDAAVFEQAGRSIQHTGEWNGEIRAMAKGGVMLTVEGRWTLLRDAQGQAKSILTIDTDVTERKKLEQQFLRAQRMESLGTLAGGIAHDLNNLLAPILMGVGLLQRLGLDERNLRVVQNIERSARRGADLVKQVLSFARGVEGARVAVSLRHIVQEVELIVQNTFPKNISLETDLPRDLWLVTGDPTQLNQVVMNLCVNARDAMPMGGVLTLKVSNAVVDEQYAVMNREAAAGRYVVLEVADVGCGMPREVLDRIFEPFFTTKELGRGTGLGLSTVIGIVRSHGGFVNVYSEVGKGSVFKVYLPAQAQSAEAVEASPAEAEGPPRGHGEMVLVVDDEASIRDITQQTLEAFGYRVVTAEDGAQAVGVYAVHRAEIAVVITDMMMPVMDGATLIAALQRIEPRVRIIAASGLAANGQVVRATTAGVKHFLAKPYSASAMLALLRTVLAEEGSQRPA